MATAKASEKLAIIGEELRRQNEHLRAMQAALAAERQRFNDVLNMLPAYVVLLSPDYQVPFANRFFEERFGKSNGRRCYEYLFGSAQPCENCETFKVLKTGVPHRWEWTGPDGRNYDIYDFPFTDADGSPLILEMGIDVTETKRAQAALKDANETLEQHVAQRTEALEEATAELQRSNQDLQQFAYAASHDLQEPLRAVSGFLRLLEKKYGPQLDAEARELIDFAVDGAGRMSDLIRDLLAYSRVERKGKEPRPVDAERCLAAALVNLDAGIREADAQVTHDRLPTLTVDGVQLTQLFQNLIGNAIKFRKPDQPCLIHVGADQDKRQWVLSVRDNGIGIAPSNTDASSISSNASTPAINIRARASGWRSASGSSSGMGGGFGSSRNPAKGRPSGWRCSGTMLDAPSALGFSAVVARSKGGDWDFSSQTPEKPREQRSRAWQSYGRRQIGCVGQLKHSPTTPFSRLVGGTALRLSHPTAICPEKSRHVATHVHRRYHRRVYARGIGASPGSGQLGNFDLRHKKEAGCSIVWTIKRWA